MIWLKALGVPRPGLMPAVRSRHGALKAWLDRQPLWVRSLLYTLRMVLVVVLFFAIPIGVGELAGRTWKYVTFGGFWCLVLWGYVHALHCDRQGNRPKASP